MDAIFTIWAINQGAVELNPIMNFFLEYNNYLFIVIKIMLIASASFLLYKANKYNWVQKKVFKITIGATILFASIVIYELIILGTV